MLNRSFTTNRGILNMNKENVAGSSPTNRENIDIDKEIIKEGRNPHSNRGNVNREKDKKINKI